MALETGWTAKVRDILYMIPYCRGYIPILVERYYQICDLLGDEKRGFYNREKEYEYINIKKDKKQALYGIK